MTSIIRNQPVRRVAMAEHVGRHWRRLGICVSRLDREMKTIVQNGPNWELFKDDHLLDAWMDGEESEGVYKEAMLLPA